MICSRMMAKSYCLENALFQAGQMAAHGVPDGFPVLQTHTKGPSNCREEEGGAQPILISARHCACVLGLQSEAEWTKESTSLQLVRFS